MKKMNATSVPIFYPFTKYKVALAVGGSWVYKTFRRVKCRDSTLAPTTQVGMWRVDVRPRGLAAWRGVREQVLMARRFRDTHMRESGREPDAERGTELRSRETPRREQRNARGIIRRVRNRYRHLVWAKPLVARASRQSPLVVVASRRFVISRSRRVGRVRHAG